MSQFGNETMIPLLPCVLPDETITFCQALGFQITYQMRRPYLYLVLRWQGIELHYGPAPKGLDPIAEHSGGLLVMVDDAAPYHAAFTRGMRHAYGKVLGKGLPRMTRFRPGQSRFSIVDPSGNNIIFCQRDEPEDLNYGGDPALDGLARVIDNARLFRDFKTDYVAAARILDTGLRKFLKAGALDRARALAARAELAVLLGESNRAAEIDAELSALSLTDQERAMLVDDLSTADELKQWLQTGR